VILAGRSQETYNDAVASRPELKGCKFVQCDATDATQVAKAAADVDLVVHCAGPFQRNPSTAGEAPAATAPRHPSPPPAPRRTRAPTAPTPPRPARPPQ